MGSTLLYCGKHLARSRALQTSSLLKTTYIGRACYSSKPTVFKNESGDKFSTEITYRTLQKSQAKVVHLAFSNSPKKYAFMNMESMTNLRKVFHGLEERMKKTQDIRAVFIRSTFPGADIREMSKKSSFDAAEEFISTINKLCALVYQCPAPVIAVIDGPCMGAGMELAAACDLRIAVKESATFAMPETLLGIPSVAQASLLPGLIGWGRARELVFFGEAIDAEKAHQWGFVNTLTTKEELDKTIENYEAKIDATGPGALLSQKRVIKHWQSHDAGILGCKTPYTDRQFAHQMETGEPSRLMKAFLGK